MKILQTFMVKRFVCSWTSINCHNYMYNLENSVKGTHKEDDKQTDKQTIACIMKSDFCTVKINRLFCILCHICIIYM